MRGRVWGPLAIAIALASMTAGGIVITQNNPPAGDGVANIWIDSNGGSCTDGALRVYVDAEACSTLDLANDTCEGGDLVRIKTGTTIGTSSTGTTAVTGSNSRVNACVVREENGGNITVTGTLSLNSGASDLTIYNPVWTNQTSTTTDEWASLYVDAVDDITVYNMDSSTAQWFGCLARCTFIGGDVGPCISDRASPLCIPKIANSASTSQGYTLKDIDIHDQKAVLPAVNNCGSDSCHTVGLAIFGGGNILIDGVSFYNNMTTNIRMQNCCGNAPSNITIQNSRFGYVVQYYDSGADTYGPVTLNAIDTDTPMVGLITRFNSFWMVPGCTGAGGTGCGNGQNPLGTSGSPHLFRGNIMSNPNCGTNGNLDNQNVWREWSEFTFAQCGASNTLLDYLVAVPYVDAHAPGTRGEPNFHITGAAWAGDGKVTTGCSDVPLDADGNPRVSPCDAGAYERATP